MNVRLGFGRTFIYSETLDLGCNRVTFVIILEDRSFDLIGPEMEGLEGGGCEK